LKERIRGCESLFNVLKGFVVDAIKRVPLTKAKIRYEIDQFTDYD
jgi:hypothetical protein